MTERPLPVPPRRAHDGGVRKTLLLAAAMSCFLVLSVAPASAGQSIGPEQAFAGSVAGSFDGATISMRCHGHATTGRPVRGQSLEVYSPPPPIAYGTIHIGDTGAAATSIVAFLREDPSIVLARFTTSFQVLSIPTSLRLPCSGSGTVRFAPRPASSTSRAAWVSVVFASST